MIKLNVFNLTDDTKKPMTLKSEIFGIKPHIQAMHDVLVAQRASFQQGTHLVKGRGMVSGGGRKPWKQKGTGRARQGSIRAPQWRGGGIVFGPTNNVNYNLKVNKKVYQLGIKSLLSQKILDKEITIINELKITEFATKKIIEVLKKFKLDNKKVLIINDIINKELVKSISNLPNVKVILANEINPIDVSNNNMILATKTAITKIEEALK